MSLIKEQDYSVCFGGSYREEWTADYRMTVRYEGQRRVLARRQGGGWTAVGGDEALCRALRCAPGGDFARRYFAAAAETAEAVAAQEQKGLSLAHLYENRTAPDPLAAVELMRVLLDERGFFFEDAYAVAARWGGGRCPDEGEQQQLYPLQPRSAHVCALLRRALATLPAVAYSSADSVCRTPARALRTGEECRLAFRVFGSAVRSAVLLLEGETLRRELPMERQGEEFIVRFSAPEEAEALRFSFRLESEGGTFYLLPDEGGVEGVLSVTAGEGFRLTVFEKSFDTPEWFRGRVMYQIFPDRFAFSQDGTAERGLEEHRRRGQTPEWHADKTEMPRWQPREGEKDYRPEDFYGGTFRGIEEKLPYLESLGVGCVYLNPIVEASSNHRYDTGDYLRPDPILGSLEDFTHLCEAAEKRKIRILLDGVFSHTGADSVYFNRFGHYPGLGAAQGEGSPYFRWYDFRAFPDDYRCWWGFRDLPEVDEGNADWQSFVVSGENSVVRQWLRRGAAGWRLDVADELPDEVLCLIRRAAKAEKRDALVLGEVWEDALIKESYGKRRRYALGGALDSVMNYPFRTAVLDFIHRRSDAPALRDFLRSQRLNYPEPMYYSLMNLLGSHDVERILTALATSAEIKTLPREKQAALSFSREELALAQRRERLCALLQFAIPGVPSVYYGDEQGMCGGGDPFNRAPFADRGSPLRDYYAALAALRNENPVLQTGETAFLAPTAEVLAVVRYDGTGNAFLFLLNRGEATEVTVDLSVCGRTPLTAQIGALEGRWQRL